MRAVLVSEFGGPEQLRPGQAADPVAGSGQVRVSVHAARGGKAPLVQWFVSALGRRRPWRIGRRACWQLVRGGAAGGLGE